ncbi:MAG: hypothetical protein HPY70_04970 [Firmicutes bacterium]|nr:hypothetical protein [Bacillota bacterium]
MWKHIKTDITIIIIFLGIVFLGTWFYMSYTQPKEIHYTYNGIKYHKAKKEIAEPVCIEINGKYKRSFWGERDEFVGKVIIGNEVFIFSRQPIVFNKNMMAPFVSYGRSHHGTIFASRMFKEITIDVHEYDGYLISAPCNDRKEAVHISNRLMKKTFMNLKIE